MAVERFFCCCRRRRFCFVKLSLETENVRFCYLILWAVHRQQPSEEPEPKHIMLCSYCTYVRTDIHIFIGTQTTIWTVRIYVGVHTMHGDSLMNLQ